MYNLEGDEFQAKLKSYDIKTDLAILDLPSNVKLDVLPLCNSDIQINDITFVANKGKIEKGFVKNILKTVPGYNEYVLKYFEIENIQVENGSSGSPVLNIKGEVIGIVSAKAIVDKKLIAYAIPISDTKELIDTIKEGFPYHHNILGIEVEEIPNNNNNFPGLFINEVYENKIAYNFLHVGDVIKRFDGQEITNSNDLAYILFKAISSQEHNLEIIRGGTQYLSLSFKLN